MLGDVTVLLVGSVANGHGGFDEVDSVFEVTEVPDLDEADREEDPGAVVVDGGSVAAAVERFAAPVVAATDDPPAALAAGADEVVRPEAPAGVVEHRVRATVERRRRRRRERALLDDPLTGIVILDPDGRVRELNEAARQFEGLERGTVIGEFLWRMDWIVDSTLDVDDVRDAVERALDGDRVRLRTETQDSQRVPRDVDVVLRPLAGRGPERVVVEARDVAMVADEGAPMAPPTRRLRTIVDNLPIVLFAIDDDGTFTLSEGRGLEKLGLEAGEIVGESIADVYGDNEEILTAVERAFDGEHVNHVVEVDDLVFESWYQPVFENGAVRNVLGAAIDVTDQVERERELERYRTLVETVGDPMYVLDADGHVEMVNEAMAAHLGYDRDQMVGMHVSSVLTEDSVARAERLIAALLADDDRRWGTCELTVVDAGGEATPYEDNIGIITGDEGDLVASVGVIRDVTERVERERELEQYETIVETIPDGVFVIDEEGTIVGGNDTASEMFGYDASELDDDSFFTLVDDGVVDETLVDRYVDTVRELLSSDTDAEKAKFEYEVNPPDRGVRHLESHVSLRPYDDEFRGTIGINRDVTDRKERERQLRRQNERLEEFASVVSHDLRNPLNVARGTVDLLAEDIDAEGLETVHESLARMEELIENLLALAREGQTVTDPGSVDLSGAVPDAWSSISAGDADVAVETDAVVEADRPRLRQLLENLMGNAVTHGGPDVRIEVGSLADGAGFYVADDGPGIDEDARGDVFEYGYTTRQDGTGFGLAIVRSIAEAHGWDVRITESDAGGARFEFTGVEFAD